MHPGNGLDEREYLESAPDKDTTIGHKHDQSKPRWDLLPFGPLAEVVKVVTYGAAKYGPRDWQGLEHGRDRYFAATHRHLQAWWQGESHDPESKLHHLAHAGCNVLFLLWFEGHR